MTNNKPFKNLNAIRFIAAFMVIIHHIEQIKSILHIPNYWENNTVVIIGKLGVVIFFVLSGFLISYLLLKEQEITKTIHIKKFYMRRILRICPLYFLIIFVSFFILPFMEVFKINGFDKSVIWHDLYSKLLLYTLFLPNLAASVYGFMPYIHQTWSIGAEEQFYLLYPVLNKYIKNKWAIAFGVISIYLVVKFSFHFLPENKYIALFKLFWLSTPIDCMAIGGIFALIIYEQTAFVITLRKILFTKHVQIITCLLTIILIYNAFYFPYLHFEFYAVLFGILITNFACNEQRLFSMENYYLNYLGKTSYSLYILHPIAITLAIKLLDYYKMQTNYLLYPLVSVIVVLMSIIIYELFEKVFINKKSKYTSVKSVNAQQ